MMDKEFKYLGLIVAILIVAALFIKWGLPGAIYPLEGASVSVTEDTITVSVSGVPQSYNAFFDGGIIQLITLTEAPNSFSGFTFDRDASTLTFSLGGCGSGRPQSVALSRMDVPGYANRLVVNVQVPSIRSYWEGGGATYWTITCGQDQLSQQNPAMLVSGSIVFRKPPVDPCLGIVCNPIERTCEDGFVATCQTSCSEGVCSSCQPDCTGHEVEPPGPGPGPEPTPDINLISVIILAIIFIGIFGFIGWKVWGWKR